MRGRRWMCRITRVCRAGVTGCLKSWRLTACYWIMQRLIRNYVADEAAMWQRFYNGLLLMTLPFSLLVVLAYWAMGEDY